MHRDPYSRHNERRVEPSSLAKEARDRWIAANGGEEAIKRRIGQGGGPSTADLDQMVTVWHAKTFAAGRRRLETALWDVQVRQLRRARRLVRLCVVLTALSFGSALAIVVWFVILGNH